MYLSHAISEENLCAIVHCHAVPLGGEEGMRLSVLSGEEFLEIIDLFVFNLRVNTPQDYRILSEIILCFVQLSIEF